MWCQYQSPHTSEGEPGIPNGTARTFIFDNLKIASLLLSHSLGIARFIWTTARFGGFWFLGNLIQQDKSDRRTTASIRMRDQGSSKLHPGLYSLRVVECGNTECRNHGFGLGRRRSAAEIGIQCARRRHSSRAAKSLPGAGNPFLTLFLLYIYCLRSPAFVRLHSFTLGFFLHTLFPYSVRTNGTKNWP